MFDDDVHSHLATDNREHPLSFSNTLPPRHNGTAQFRGFLEKQQQQQPIQQNNKQWQNLLRTSQNILLW